MDDAAIRAVPESPKKRGVQSSLQQPEGPVLSIKKRKTDILSSAKKNKRSARNQIDEEVNQAASI